MRKSCVKIRTEKEKRGIITMRTTTRTALYYSYELSLLSLEELQANFRVNNRKREPGKNRE